MFNKKYMKYFNFKRIIMALIFNSRKQLLLTNNS